MPAVITLTMNPALDVCTQVATLKPWDKLRCNERKEYPGGGGINVARTLAMLGVQVTAVYPHGGSNGLHLKRLLDESGVPQRAIPIDGETRECLLVQDRSSNEVYRFIMPGPALLESEWRLCLDEVEALLQAGDVMVASGSLPKGVVPDFYARVARLTKQKNARLLLDSSGLSTVNPALREGLWVLRMNKQEFAELTGTTFQDAQQFLDVMSEFVRHYAVELLIVTQGKQGAFLVSSRQRLRVSVPTVPFLCPSGAGDCFVAGFIAQWLHQASLDVALRYAVASASAALLTPGGELARMEDIERLFNQTQVMEDVHSQVAI